MGMHHPGYIRCPETHHKEYCVFCLDNSLQGGDTICKDAGGKYELSVDGWD
ncbi:hypothetical protein AAIR98_000724 [Elusimicrobium simillimum]|uniref:hypothetical protein n=1 Tax=Elusimicrobium simillimum TaxID=3143438 RepID=UPI003C703566